MLSLLAKDKFYPFPPFYSSGLFIFSTPLFITPTVLFLFVSVVGLYRYLKTKSVPWQDISSPLVTPNRRLSPLSRLIVALSCLVTVTFLIDTVVVVTRVILDEGSLSIMLLYYIAFSWFAWVISLVCLIDESHKFSKWYWLQYTFYAMAVTGETCVAWLWASSVYNPRPGKIYT
jgi:ATP-binding cassette subfamily B (MDR/TAP) protein 6